ncbi:hypothetical protein IFM89_036949 [Coptis chinensis]|uniref:F-box domain-containing protein n=1 Tax=Coptis chinensis TaxID=261450 RepID=A0A835LNV3_9MAGN|nr:hypothetical protein IFM89_036949 [Coptis chinensis]
MLFFLISCFSFILLSKSLSLPRANEMRLLSLWFCKELPCFLVLWLKKRKLSGSLSDIPAMMSFKKRPLSSKVENVEEIEEMSILDLPELTLECILGMLPPSSLCNMAGVCSSLRERCTSDHLWERHMKEKWGKVIGKAACRQWQWHIATKKDYSFNKSTHKGLWPLSWIRSTLDNHSKPMSPLPVDSIMSRYISFESGKFWFPAQVYNREHGHVGFMLSCYDAELCYDRRTDTFRASYPTMKADRTIVTEEGVGECGVVGHLELCDRNENYCQCHSSDTVVLEFNQYTPGSRWRQTIIDRKDHREEGNEADGFYGGIRKLYNLEELAMWKRLWPKEALE